MQTIPLKSLDDLDAILMLARSEYEQHGPRTVVIKAATQSLSERQRGQYWRWLGVIAQHHGYSKEEMHEEFKRKFFTNIYLADPENHKELCEGVETLKGLQGKISPEQYASLKAMILDSISHLDATDKNMTDVLACLEAHATKYQIKLPANRDLQ